MPNSVSVTWHAHKDDRTCKICRALDGYKWVYNDEVPESLIHPAYGEVWNTTTGSLAHEIQYHKGSKYGLISNCRCSIEPKVESLADLAAAVRRLKEEIKEALGEGKDADDTKGGATRKTTLEDIGIDLSKYGLE